jgi:hypothetical protein
MAGPPFQTDDPEPVPYRHYEFYSFSTLDRGADGSVMQIPAVEYNLGAAPNLQLHVVSPLAMAVPDNGATEIGPGDIELGAKYRFLDQKGVRPQIGVFPMIELPSGDSKRGLGNGQLWARIPFWLQKSRGPWTTYGGAGYEINRASKMQDSVFAGWLVQRDIGRKVTLGGEFFMQTAQVIGGCSSSFLDGGGYYYFSRDFQLLFMLGRTVAGNSHLVGYWGLYWTW